MLLLMNGGLAARAARSRRRSPPTISTSRWSPTCCGSRRCFYLANPFIALGHALLMPADGLPRQAQVNLIAAVLSAVTALACAYAGLGVWTLVAAPVGCSGTPGRSAISSPRGSWIRPSFRFAGAGTMLRYGGAMIARPVLLVRAEPGRHLHRRPRCSMPHRLGLYTTALFLTQILAAKFVPPLNEVAFAAYSRIQDAAGHDPAARSSRRCG